MKTSNYFLSITILICAFSNYLVSRAEYPTDTTTYSQLTEFVTNIGDINGDKVQDTLMSYLRKNGHSFPTSIHWGRIHIDSLLKVSILKYPNWDQIDARITVDDYDMDTTSDMMFYLWGKIYQDSSNTIDTGKVILLWGQTGLDTLETINLDSLLDTDDQMLQKGGTSTNYYDSNPKNPNNFKRIEIKELRVGKEIFNPVSNLNSSGYSFEVRIPKRLNKKKVEDYPQIPVEKDKWGISIFPNPNDGIIFITSDKLPVGIYNLVIFDNIGNEVYNDILSINSLLHNKKSIELTNPINGVYHLVIHNKNEIFGKYKFVIIK